MAALFSENAPGEIYFAFPFQAVAFCDGHIDQTPIQQYFQPNMNWFYIVQGKQAGPVTDEQFDEMFRGGTITPETLVWREGMADWAPCSQAKSGSIPASGPRREEAVCAECGKLFPTHETIRYGDSRVCATCKPVFLQKLQEGASLTAGGVHYAGFWIRLGAKLLDGLIIGVPMMIVFFLLIYVAVRPLQSSQGPSPFMILLPSFLQIGFFFLLGAYNIFFIGRYGATLGKMACRIHVVTSEGGKVSYARATGRFFSEMLSAMICDIGYIIAAFDGQKRALHDHLCNTRVIYK